MPNATDLWPSAANQAYDNLLLDSENNVLQSAVVAFNEEWVTVLDQQSQLQRTVLNWIVPLSEVAVALPATAGFQQAIIANAAAVLVRMLTAAQTALDAGRISSAQGTAILNAYNTHIAQF